MAAMWIPATLMTVIVEGWLLVMSCIGSPEMIDEGIFEAILDSMADSPASTMLDGQLRGASTKSNRSFCPSSPDQHVAHYHSPFIPIAAWLCFLYDSMHVSARDRT